MDVVLCAKSAWWRADATVRAAVVAAAEWLRDDRNRELRNSVAHPEAEDLAHRASRLAELSASIACLGVGVAARDRLLRGMQLAASESTSVRSNTSHNAS